MSQETPEEERQRFERYVTRKLGGIEGGLDKTLRTEQRASTIETESYAALPLITVAAATNAEEAHGAQEYTVVQELGAGGMGVVVLARQRSLQREVAIKVPHAEVTDEEAQTSLLHEAVLTGGLEHPNVIPVHAIGRDARGRPLLVMKRVAGESWASVLEEPARLSSKQLQRDRLGFHLDVLLQLCNVLHFAHSRGVLHRDLKPENVMLGEFGELYLLDWGIAWRLEETRAERCSRDIVGTLAYMAPEMLRGSGPHLSPRTDVYLLGAVLHQVLTGKPRHQGATVGQCVLDILQSEAVSYPDAVPAELAALCNRATHKEPSERPATAMEFREALEQFLLHRSSLQLLEESEARFRELLSQLEGGAAVDAASLYRTFSECRFGLQQALRIWEGNAPARALLREALAKMCDFELSRRKLASAESLLAELDAPASELAARVGALREELAREKRRLAELEHSAHQQDARVSSKPRALGAVAAAFLISGVLAGIGYAERLGRMRLEYDLVFGSLAVFSVAAFGLFLAARQAMLRTKLNRNFLLVLSSASGGAFLVALYCRSRGYDAHEVIPLVLLVLSVFQAAIATLAFTAIRWAALSSLLGVLGCMLWPKAVLYVAAASVFASHCSVAASWYRQSVEGEEAA